MSTLFKNETIEKILKIIQKRMKRFELSTFSLARRCSTTELHPQTFINNILNWNQKSKKLIFLKLI